MRILIPILGFGRAGGYRVLSKFADELIRLGHRVEFLCPDESPLPYYPTLATIGWVDEKGLRSINSSKSGKQDNAFSIQKKLTRALRKIPANSYDVIIANHALTTFPIWIAGLRHKTLYYVQAYEPDYYKSEGIKSSILSFLSAQSYKMKFFTVVNGKTYLDYKELKSSRILYPGIDFNLFYPTAKKLADNADNEIIIGTIGRTEPYKGTRYVIEAFQKLGKKYANIKLHVAFGNPQDFINYENIHCFQLHGDEELANFYRSLDYYICAAYIQLGAFHYPVSEAMSCGVPVITTHYYPANEMNAWMVNTLEDSEEIVTQFELAQSDPSIKQKKIEQALMDVQQFEWKMVGERLNNYVQELAGQLLAN